MKKKFWKILPKLGKNAAVAIIGVTILLANNAKSVEANEKASRNNIYYINQDDVEFYNAGNNKGYAKKKKVTSKDPHGGWKLGNFVITGFTSKDISNKKDPVFLKTVGDDITLAFNLNQNINRLDNNDKKFVVDDKKGFDEQFGTKKMNFQKGALLIRYTDPDNKERKPVIYENFLTGKSKKASNMSVVLHEEGEYEVALDYKIKSAIISPFGKSIGTCDSYRWYFKFRVQNGNDMGFIRENGSGKELKNCSFTNSGFYIDLANSKYLNVQVKREELNEAGTELVTDTRSNKVAADGENFTTEGIYTVTVRNEHVDEPTIKTIYVGNDDLLKAYITTGRSISDIKDLLDRGATVAEDGTIVRPVKTTTERVDSTKDKEEKSVNKKESNNMSGVIIGILIVVACLIVLVIRKYRKNRNTVEDKVDNQ